MNFKIKMILQTIWDPIMCEPNECTMSVY